MQQASPEPEPLADLDEWEDDLLRRYPEEKSKEEFRDYDADARPSVREFYRLNHTYQTLDFVKQKHDQFLSLDRGKKSIWDGLEYLNTLVDESDPDTDLSQIAHLLQTSWQCH